MSAQTSGFTCLGAAHGNHTIAIEPLTINLTALSQNLLCNNLLDVEVFPLGLSSKAGIKRLFGVNTGASFLPVRARASDKWHARTVLRAISRISAAPQTHVVERGSQVLIVATEGIHYSPPPIIAPKPRFVLRWRCYRFAFWKETCEPGFHTAVSKHIERKIDRTSCSAYDFH